MLKLILVRHGESVWNKTNRFTGWTDVGLSEKGIEEARKAGKALKEKGFKPKVAFTSYLNRAIKTLWLMLEEMDMMYLPEYKSWRLNEKHYGMLQGLNKIETAEKYGDEQVHLWRRSYDSPPPPLSENDERSPKLDPRYADVDPENIPLTEALKDVVERMLPYWEDTIAPALKEHKEVIVSAHGNSLRAVVKYLKNMSEDEILKFNIPTGIPYIFEFDEDLNLQKDYFTGDEEEVRKAMEKVANQAKKK
ncbi:MAG: 2,3-diphosphoglycerate-dependent phosphoglycerate mutase [Bacteroidota bacterium]|nr:2,3-diphosphoglycerate-dependent phosphoglycerate mutase [Bacteroidota bacterium]